MQNKYTKKYFEKYALLSLALCYDSRLLGMCYDKVKYESPDFQNQTLNLGLEVTEAITSKYGKERSVVHSYFGKGLPALKVIEDSERRFGKIIKGKIQLVNDMAVYSEYKGLYNTHIRLDLLQERIISKTKKLNGNYTLFANNWLYVFSGTGILDEDDMGEVQRELRGWMNQYKILFDKIFINCVDQVFIIEKHEKVSSFFMNDSLLKKIKELASELVFGKA